MVDETHHLRHGTHHFQHLPDSGLIVFAGGLCGSIPRKGGQVESTHTKTANLGAASPERIGIAEVVDVRPQTAARRKGAGLAHIDVDETEFQIVFGDAFDEGGVGQFLAVFGQGEAGRHHREGGGVPFEDLVEAGEEDVLHLLHGLDTGGLAVDDVGGHELAQEGIVIDAHVGERALVATELPVERVDERGQVFGHIGPHPARATDFDVVVVAGVQHVIHIAGDDDEQVGQAGSAQGAVGGIDRELLHMAQEGEQALGRDDVQTAPHLQALQGDVVHGVVEAVGATDVPAIVDVEGTAYLGFDGGVGGFHRELLAQGAPQVVQGVQLHVRLGHLVIEGDDAATADVGVGVDAVVSRGRALAVGCAEELAAHEVDVELFRCDARQREKLRRVFLAELFEQGHEGRVEGLGEEEGTGHYTSMYSSGPRQARMSGMFSFRLDSFMLMTSSGKSGVFSRRRSVQTVWSVVRWMTLSA